MNNPHNYEYEVLGETSYLYLYRKNGNKYTVTIDTKNLEKVLNFKYKWFIGHYKINDTYCARASVYVGKNEKRNSTNYTLLLHNFIMGLDSEDVDHINNDTLDNRETNLRPTTHTNNNKNRKSKNKNNKSGYRNVCTINGYYRIQLQIDGKNFRFPEKFTDIKLAAEFAQEMREKYYGEFAGKQN